MKAREGDLVKTETGHVFDVKGLVHPPNRIAFLRYFPHRKGERKKGSTAYGKVYSLPSRYKMLQRTFPSYLVFDPVFDETLCEVPTEDISEQFEPVEKLRQLRRAEDLDNLESKSTQLASSLKKSANVPWNAIGISGSILVGLHNANSDIDPIAYGSENCRKVHSALGSLLSDEQSGFKPYSSEDLKALFDFRSKDTATSFEDFVRTESGKDLQGKFMGTDYFIRFVKDWNEIGEAYSDVHYTNCGCARIKATIIDDSESIFTPCVYKIGNVRFLEGSEPDVIGEIASFRGRFCEQARNGESVIAQGKIEHVTDCRRNREYSRLLLGNRRSDFMILA